MKTGAAECGWCGESKLTREEESNLDSPYFSDLAQVPAFVAIGLWFVFQLISGLGVLGNGAQQGGVAYAAHVGGFIAGLVLIKIFEIGRPRAD